MTFTCKFFAVAGLLALPLAVEAGDALVEHLAQEPESVFSVGMNGGVPTPFYNGKPVSMLIYSAINATPRVLRHVPAISGTGIHYYEVPMNFYETLGEDGKTDFSQPLAGLRTVLEMDENAYVMVRIYMATPGWWHKQHPDQLAQTLIKPDPGIESAASQAWVDDTNALLNKYLAALEKSPYGKRILGYHLDWGRPYGEWHYPGFSQIPDSSPVMTTQFRRWLAVQYGAQPEFATVQIPDLDARNQSYSASIFRDPANPVERRVADYYRCQHDALSNSMLSFCKTAKRAVGGKKLIGVFYGYYFHMGLNNTEQAEGGHLALAKVLASPDVDFLSGPYSYQYESRKVGGDGCIRTITESVKLHGKLFITEVDEPTYLGCSQGVDIKGRGTDTLAGSLSAMRRNFANTLIHGTDSWWFDIGPKDTLGGFAGGWWNTPEFLTELKRFKGIASDSLTHNRASAAQIAVVCNPDSYYYIVCHLSGKDKLTHPLLHQTVSTMYHAGAPFDLVLASDLERLDYPRYKLLVFLDTFFLTPAERQTIERKVKANGHTVLWVYAPGYITPASLSVQAMSELTGMQTELVPELHFAQVTPVANPILNADGALQPFGVPVPVLPVFAVNDKTVQVLGNIFGTGQCGFALKKFPDWTSIYTYAAPTSTPLLRRIYRLAGVHVYNDADDVLYADRNYVAITGLTGGPRTIRLPAKAEVTDLFSGKRLADSAREFSFPFDAGSTRLFLVAPPKK
jgi:hypothetical protein